MRLAWALLLLALAGVHVVLALERPLHIDTLLTGGKMLLGWGELWEDTRNNAFPPLYYLGMRLYTAVVGVSPALLLLPSMLSIIASAPALAWAIRPWVRDARTRWLAAALAGLHGFPLLYGSAFAKAYAPMWLLMIVGVGLHVRLVEGELEGRPRDRALERWQAAGFVACCVLASQIHFPGVLLPLLCLAHALLLRLRLGVRGALLRRTAFTTVGTLALFALWTGRVSTRLGEGTGLGWIQEMSFPARLVRMWTDAWWQLAGSVKPSAYALGSPERDLAGVALVLGGIVLVFTLRELGLRPLDRRAASARWLLALALLLPYATLLAIDRFRPLYHPRYVGEVLFPAAVLLAVGVMALGRRRPVAAVAVALALFAGRGIGLWQVGVAPIHLDWAGLYRGAVVRAAELGIDALVLPSSDWPDVSARYLAHLYGPVPEGLDLVWIGPAGGPVPEEVRRVMLRSRSALAAGFVELPAWFTPPRWDLRESSGETRIYEEVTGRVETRTRFVFFERPPNWAPPG